MFISYWEFDWLTLRSVWWVSGSWIICSMLLRRASSSSWLSKPFWTSKLLYFCFSISLLRSFIFFSSIEIYSDIFSLTFLLFWIYSWRLWWAKPAMSRLFLESVTLSKMDFLCSLSIVRCSSILCFLSCCRYFMVLRSLRRLRSVLVAWSEYRYSSTELFMLSGLLLIWSYRLCKSGDCICSKVNSLKFVFFLLANEELWVDVNSYDYLNPCLVVC